MTTSGQPPFSIGGRDPQYDTNDINLERRVIVEKHRQQRIEQSGTQPNWFRRNLDVIAGLVFVAMIILGIWLLAIA